MILALVKSGQAIYSGLQVRATCGGVEQVSNLLAGQVANLPYGQAWSHILASRYNRRKTSQTQNGFIAHFYLRPDTRTAYITAFNPHAIPKEGEPDTGQQTRWLKRASEDYLFKHSYAVLTQTR